MSKISELPEKLSAMVDADLFVIVDSAEADPNLQTKKITKVTAGLGGGGGDFADGGEAGGADRSLGNTDDFALSFLQNGQALLALAVDNKIDVLYGEFESQVADGASAIGFNFDTTNTFATAGAKIASFSTGGTERAYLDYLGNFYLLKSQTYPWYFTGSSNNLKFGCPNRNSRIVLLDCNSFQPDVSGIPLGSTTKRWGGLFNELIKIRERAAAESDSSDWGQLWVKDDAPNTFWFTDDTGNDFPLNIFYQDDTDVYGLRNGATTTELRIYNTYDGVDDEFASLGFKNVSNVFSIEGEAIGAGNVRGVNLAASGGTLGFYTQTPVVQQSGTGETVGFTAGSGTGVNDDSTFTGNVGSTAYRISDVVKALKNYGLLAT